MSHVISRLVGLGLENGVCLGIATGVGAGWAFL